MAVALMAAPFQSCSDDDKDKDKDDEGPSVLEERYFSIEDAIYRDEAIPTASTTEAIEGVEFNTQVMNGAMNYITIITEQEFTKFFVGVQGVDGHWEYSAAEASSSRSTSMSSYIIPMMMSNDYTGSSTVCLAAELASGEITPTITRTIEYIETIPGDLEIKLAFSNSKDIDLHLITPSGEHIYYNHKGGEYTLDDGTVITYGLDIDSNAGCNLDHINKENIYIPEELIEAGTYTVMVDLFSNCDPSIATSWSIIARYKGDLIIPSSGANPAVGIYEIGAPAGDHTEVMTFSIINAPEPQAQKKARESWHFTPAKLTEAEQAKIDFANF